MQHSVVTVVNALTRGALKQRPKPETREEPREWIVVEGAATPSPPAIGSLGSGLSSPGGPGQSPGRSRFLCVFYGFKNHHFCPQQTIQLSYLGVTVF